MRIGDESSIRPAKAQLLLGTYADYCLASRWPHLEKKLSRIGKRLSKNGSRFCQKQKDAVDPVLAI